MLLVRPKCFLTLPPPQCTETAVPACMSTCCCHPPITGVEIANRGQIRFVRKGPQACSVTLTISYEVPDVLAPFAEV